MADTANIRVDGSAAAGIGCTRRLLDAQGAGADQWRPGWDPGREPSHVGDERLHLATPKRQRAPIHTSLHASVDPIFERNNKALAPAILRELSPDAGQRHC